jgi:hypothetical protein
VAKSASSVEEDQEDGTDSMENLDPELGNLHRFAECRATGHNATFD